MDGWTDGQMLSANSVPKSRNENQTQRLMVHVEVEGDNESVNEGRVMHDVSMPNLSNEREQSSSRAASPSFKQTCKSGLR